MSTVTPDTERAGTRESSAVRTSYILPDGRADLSVLEDKLPEQLKTTRGAATLVAALGIVFFLLCRLPLWHTDIWGHIAYGRWMAQAGQLPETEPLLTLADGMPWVDTAWASKLVGYWMFDWSGAAGLQFLHAVLVTAALSVVAWSVLKTTRSYAAALFAAGVFLFVDYKQLVIQRPQDVGLLCFCVAMVLSLKCLHRRWVWFALPATFIVWANFHGSFPAGLLMLGTFAAGRAIDVFRLTRKLSFAFRSPTVWRSILLTQLAAAGVLVNPRGLGIYADALSIARNPNLQILLDWSPLTLRMWQAQAFVVVMLTMLVIYRLSPRRVSASEVLLLAGFGVLAWWSLRMIVWWGPLAGYFFAVHLAACWRAFRRAPLVAALPQRRGLWSVASLGLIWIFFAYSPFGLERIHGQPDGDAARATFERTVSRRTPLAAVNYLHENADSLPAGLMYNSQEWGDYLQWAGPAKFDVFVNSHVHLLPQQVWRDYLEIHDGGGLWLDRLDRYGVNTVLVDTTNYNGLISALKNRSEWKEVFRDPQGMAVLFVRKTPV